jgi:hypothetical protein
MVSYEQQQLRKVNVMKKAMILASLMALSTVVVQAINLEVIFKDAETEQVLKQVTRSFEGNEFTEEDNGFKVEFVITKDEGDHVHAQLIILACDLDNEYVRQIEKSFVMTFNEDVIMELDGCPQFDGIAVVVRATR